jgi:hypothetical protein
MTAPGLAFLVRDFYFVDERKLLQRFIWWIAKFIQALGLFEVLYGLYVGISEENLGLEFRIAGIGVLIFGAGWLIEKWLAR